MTAEQTINPNKALWEKGDFTRVAASMRGSGECAARHLLGHGHPDRGDGAVSPMRRLAALAFVALTFAPAAHAATKGPVFGLRAVGNNQRGYFVFTLNPDAAQTGAVIVSNVVTAAGAVKLFTTDATTGRTTGTVYETNKQPKRAGSWVTLSSTAVTLAPGGHQQAAFTVTCRPAPLQANGSEASSPRRPANRRARRRSSKRTSRSRSAT